LPRLRQIVTDGDPYLMKTKLITLGVCCCFALTVAPKAQSNPNNVSGPLSLAFACQLLHVARLSEARSRLIALLLWP
jgi:hypothetical protein